MSSPTEAQSQDEQLKAAWAQLTLVQGFYGRIDTKLAVILGLALGMLAMLSTRLPDLKDVTAMLGAFVLLAGWLLVLCIWHLFQVAVPQTQGGTNSLVYFKEIAALEESEFLTAIELRSTDALIRDLQGQVWRNSRILKKKFAFLEKAYYSLIAAVLPWLVAVTWVSLPKWS